MNLAVAYRFTGEDPIELEKILGRVCASLRPRHQVFCSIEHEAFFKRNGYSTEQIYSHCRAEFRKCDAVLVFLRSDEPSKGIEYEITDAKAAGKPVYLATPRDVQRYREHADSIIGYDDLDGLCSELRSYDFKITLRTRS